MIWAVIRTQFEGIHQYPDAPDEVAFLRHPHSHMFTVEAKIQQFHSERDVEYIICRRRIDAFCASAFKTSLGAMSCETIARHIMMNLQLNYGTDRRYEVGVFEDGMNGAVVTSEEN
jgi:hypothetical protein